jgi:FMN-dependent NADH-azoreductase
LVSGIPGTLGSPVDYLSPHLDSVLRFLGVARVMMLHVDGTSGPAERVESAMATAEREVIKFFT